MANISKVTAKAGAASCAATRNTRQRALVLEAVRSLHNHPTSADVYHAICRECGVVYDVEMPSEDLLSSVRDTHGFLIEGFDIIFNGLCPDCVDGA